MSFMHCFGNFVHTYCGDITQNPFVSCVLLSRARCEYRTTYAYTLEIHTCGPPCRWLLSGSGGCQCDFSGCLSWAQLEPTCVCLFMAQLRVMAMVNQGSYWRGSGACVVETSRSIFIIMVLTCITSYGSNMVNWYAAFEVLTIVMYAYLGLHDKSIRLSWARTWFFTVSVIGSLFGSWELMGIWCIVGTPDVHVLCSMTCVTIWVLILDMLTTQLWLCGSVAFFPKKLHTRKPRREILRRRVFRHFLCASIWTFHFCYFWEQLVQQLGCNLVLCTLSYIQAHNKALWCTLNYTHGSVTLLTQYCTHIWFAT